MESYQFKLRLPLQLLERIQARAAAYVPAKSATSLIVEIISQHLDELERREKAEASKRESEISPHLAKLSQEQFEELIETLKNIREKKAAPKKK